LHNRPTYEKHKELNIHRLKYFGNYQLNYFLSFPAFFSPLWNFYIFKVIKKFKIDLIIVRDLPLAATGIISSKLFDIPVIFDMAEDYVSLIKAIWARKKYSGINFLVRNPFFAKLIEKATLKRFDHIFVVVEESKDLLKKKSIPSKRISIIMNTPSVSVFSKEFKLNTNLDYLPKNRYTAIYTGGVQMGRGIQNVFKSIPSIIKKIPNFLFLIVGDGYAKNYLKEMEAKLGISDYVYWTGNVPHNSMYKLISLSKIGIIPHLINEHKNTTIPNKLFDYMIFGLPVISSDAKPLSRIIQSNKCGLIYDDQKYTLSQAIIDLSISKKEYGKNGRKAVLAKFNWEAQEPILKNIINNLYSR
jgi:glycosyltransferase involved in cell wall biosynthesis